MDVVRAPDSEPRRLGEETRRQYFGTQMRLGVTVIPPGHRQRLHSHRRIQECVYVLEGAVVAIEVAGGGEEHVALRAGDFAAFMPGPAHGLANPGDAAAVIIAVKAPYDPSVDAAAFRLLVASDWVAASAQGDPDSSRANGAQP